MAEEPGYFYIYLSNDSQTGSEAFFDDFTIMTSESYIVQQIDYYPYGMVAREFRRLGDKATNVLFQGKTYEDLTKWYDFHARQYDAALGRWFGVDALGYKMPYLSPYNAMANNPMMFVDPDGNEPVTLFIVAAIVGGGFNLWSNKDKVKDFKSGLAYFSSGALGGAVSVVAPGLGGSITAWGNVVTDIATGNLPNFNNSAELAKYVGFTALDGLGAGSAGKMSRGLISFGEIAKNGWKQYFNSSNVKPIFSFNTLDGGKAGYDIAEFAITAKKTKIVDFAGSSLRFVDDATKGSTTFFQGAKYSPKVMQQMSKADDIYHAFPKSVDGFATKFGQWSTKVGADGKTYQWLKMPGSYGGKTGTFEYIKDANGIINHRFFNVPKVP